MKRGEWKRHNPKCVYVYCPFSADVWNSVLDKFGVAWVMPSSVANLSFAWHIVSVSSKCASLFFATIWNLWWERNNWIFKDRAEPSKSVARKVFTKYATWVVSL